MLTKAVSVTVTNSDSTTFGSPPKIYKRMPVDSQAQCQGQFLPQIAPRFESIRSGPNEGLSTHTPNVRDGFYLRLYLDLNPSEAVQTNACRLTSPISGQVPTSNYTSLSTPLKQSKRRPVSEHLLYSVDAATLILIVLALTFYYFN